MTPQDCAAGLREPERFGDIRRRPDDDACSGRGLHLVNELADDFGVDDHVVGKTVWLVFKTAPLLLTTPGS
ncbi:hypothetical protein [Streptomyces atratus]|uniref:ATP-binding protein n=1 Tax=Streptomyces atratus TaxID=1893 RepID=UPI000931329C